MQNHTYGAYDTLPNSTYMTNAERYKTNFKFYQQQRSILILFNFSKVLLNTRAAPKKIVPLQENRHLSLPLRAVNVSKHK